MKRIIVDYAKLTDEILALLVEKYPNGYTYSDVMSFKNSKGEDVKVVEVSTEDTIYLVKIGSQLEKSMENFDLDDTDYESDFFEH